MPTPKEHSKIMKGDSGAIFSDCRNYRYVLWRRWNTPNSLFQDSTANHIMFIGLNPSTADETHNDPTIRRVIKFAKSWGYNGVYMLNLFALIDPNPKALKKTADPLGDNNGWLELISGITNDVLFAWGTFKEAKQRAEEVIRMFPNAICLGKNADGSPKHPLYIAANTIPKKFNQ